mmetsp:Transcript_3673/g.7149  ORF Transcript_3673/g.7149 Transcript_3673/m.7149 type:complete len:205 (-) Transcript_3673:498-1112(-)
MRSFICDAVGAVVGLLYRGGRSLLALLRISITDWCSLNCSALSNARKTRAASRSALPHAPLAPTPRMPRLSWASMFVGCRDLPPHVVSICAASPRAGGSAPSPRPRSCICSRNAVHSQLGLRQACADTALAPRFTLPCSFLGVFRPTNTGTCTLAASITAGSLMSSLLRMNCAILRQSRLCLRHTNRSVSAALRSIMVSKPLCL